MKAAYFESLARLARESDGERAELRELKARSSSTRGIAARTSP